MEKLSGNAAFVTGAASGIGRAIAQGLAREGVSVAIADLDADAAVRASQEIESAGGRAVAVPCDVTRPESLAEAADAASAALGPIRILVNNAGAFTVCPVEETARADWEWLLELNVLGVVNGLHTFLPRMRADGAPCHIVNTASISGHVAAPGLAIYTASKFAVMGLSECLRQELEGSPIGLSVLCPGIVKTGLLETSRKQRPSGSDESAAERDRTMGAAIETGSDPAEIGDRVVAAVKANEFYIMTHAVARPAFESRFKEILEAFRA